jgi:hypothetical protein
MSLYAQKTFTIKYGSKDFAYAQSYALGAVSALSYVNISHQTETHDCEYPSVSIGAFAQHTALDAISAGSVLQALKPGSTGIIKIESVIGPSIK